MLRCRWVFSGEIAPSSGACAGAGGWGVVRGEMARMLGLTEPLRQFTVNVL